MRLFTAILLNEEMKTNMVDMVGRLKASAKGTFTERENLHVTVNFIGETDRLEEVKGAMQRAVEKAGTGKFPLSVRSSGKFIRREGNIYWIGVEKEQALWRLQKILVKELKEEGFFDIDDHEYRPHLTLGRRVRPDQHFNEQEFASGMEPMQMEVDKISLMKSERVQGRLTYTEIYHIKL